jgi:hypothetical protein
MDYILKAELCIRMDYGLKESGVHCVAYGHLGGSDFENVNVHRHMRCHLLCALI